MSKNQVYLEVVDHEYDTIFAAVAGTKFGDWLKNRFKQPVEVTVHLINEVTYQFDNLSHEGSEGLRGEIQNYLFGLISDFGVNYVISN